MRRGCVVVICVAVSRRGECRGKRRDMRREAGGADPQSGLRQKKAEIRLNLRSKMATTYSPAFAVPSA